MYRSSFLFTGFALALSTSLQGQIVITEIMYHSADNPSSGSNGSEWIEIYNYSEEPVDLEDWRLFDERFLLTGNENDAVDPIADEDISGGVNDEGDSRSILMPGEVAVIIPSDRGANQFRFSWDLASTIKIIAPNWNSFKNQDVPTGTYDPINNTVSSTGAQPSWIHLVNNNGRVIDIVNYENGFNTEQGQEWPDTGDNGYANAKGGSIFLSTAVIQSDNPTAGNDQGTNWSISISGELGAWSQKQLGAVYSSQTTGSPGYIWGIEAIPEPRALSLLVGLVAMAGMGARRRQR